MKSLPPCDLDAERATLATLLMKPKTVAVILDELHPDDFTSPQNKRVFQAVTDLFLHGEGVDSITAANWLTEHEMLKNGDGAYIASITDGASFIPGLSHHKIVKRYSRARAFLQDLEQAHSSLMAGLPIDNVIQDFSTSFEKASSTSTKISSVGELAEQTLSGIFERADNESKIAGLPTGYTALDSMINGLVETNLIIIAARPAVGKTTLALNMAENVARSGKSVAFFSMEMSREELMEKLISRSSAVPLSRIRSGGIGSTERKKIQAATNELKSIPLFLHDQPALSIPQLTAVVKGLKMKQGLDMFVVDYIGLMRGVGQTREQEVSSISGGLKRLAMELRIPVFALSQLNRGLESRDNKRPRLADLRDSGAVEQDANIVMFLYRDEISNPSKDCPLKGVAEIIIAKNRAGETGEIQLGSSRLSYSEFVPLKPMR